MIDAEKVKTDVYARMEERGKKNLSFENEFYMRLIESIVEAVVEAVNKNALVQIENQLKYLEHVDTDQEGKIHDLRKKFEEDHKYMAANLQKLERQIVAIKPIKMASSE